jgi:hypothetical protein
MNFKGLAFGLGLLGAVAQAKVQVTLVPAIQFVRQGSLKAWAGRSYPSISTNTLPWWPSRASEVRVGIPSNSWTLR